MPPRSSPQIRIPRALAAAWLAIALLACTQLTCGFPTPNQPPDDIDNYCAEHPDECPPCESDDECIITGNACIDAPPNCHHEEANVAYPSIGCGREHYEMPPDSACDCDDSSCRADR